MNVAFSHREARPMRRLSVGTWIGNAAAVLLGRWGDVTRQAATAGWSRQTVYQHAQRVQQAVETQDDAGPTRHELLDQIQALRRENRQLWNWLEHTVEFPKAKQRHFATVAAAMGLSSRQVAALLALLLPAARGPSHATVRRWIHQEAVKAGGLLERLDRACKTLVTVACLDEIFFRRQPVLVAVEPQSMAWILGQRTRDRSGPTWAAAWQDWSALEAVVADGGTGLHAGLALIQHQRHEAHQAALDVGLDLFHTQRDAHRLVRSLGSRAEGVWTQAEAAARQVERDQTQGRDARGAAARARRAWARAIAAFHHAEGVEAAWQEITAALQVFHPDGRLNTCAEAEARLAQAIPRLSGAGWSKVIRSLRDPRTVMFLERLHRQLQEAEPDEPRRAALVRLWWLRRLRRQRSRGKSASAAGGTAHVAYVVQIQVCAGLGADWGEAYRRVARVLWSTVRASSAVECMNSVIRMHQARHRTLTQPLLDLKRLSWNCRVFGAGKRHGRCPYEHLGLKLPSYDLWELLQRSPEDLKLPEEVSTSKLAA
jgi:hypothetical protein